MSYTYTKGGNLWLAQTFEIVCIRKVITQVTMQHHVKMNLRYKQILRCQ